MPEGKRNPHEGHREKLRQRFILENGFEHFEDHQILELLLFYANPRQDTNPTAHALLNEFGSLKGVLEARPEMLMSVPNVGEKALRNLDENGVVQIGTYVKPGDILIGRVKPKNKQELAPEEKLLHAIFGRAGEDVKNDSVVVPPGVEGG